MKVGTMFLGSMFLSSRVLCFPVPFVVDSVRVISLLVVSYGA